MRLSGSNVARGFGHCPCKRTHAPGADADPLLWDLAKRGTLTNAMMKHAVDDTPYEGVQVTGWRSQ
jgi:dihydropyrimidinase